MTGLQSKGEGFTTLNNGFRALSFIRTANEKLVYHFNDSIEMIASFSFRHLYFVQWVASTSTSILLRSTPSHNVMGWWDENAWKWMKYHMCASRGDKR